VREWYANGPLGVEQGFDVVSRPVGRGAVRLAIGALPAWLAVTSGGLSITVDDRGARYPVRVDPLIQQGSKLVGSGVGFPPITARRGIMRDRRFRKRRQIDGHR
jgi:hypothetical protein